MAPPPGLDVARRPFGRPPARPAALLPVVLLLPGRARRRRPAVGPGSAAVHWGGTGSWTAAKLFVAVMIQHSCCLYHPGGVLVL